MVGTDGQPAPRYKVTVFIGAGEEMTPMGPTRDLSATGMFIQTQDRPPIDSLHEISIVWGDDTLICAAKVVRHADDGVGLMFVDPQAPFQKAVEEIIASSDRDVVPPY